MTEVTRLAAQYAELYYGDFSLTAQITMTEQLVQDIAQGDLTVLELRDAVRFLQQNPI